MALCRLELPERLELLLLDGLDAAAGALVYECATVGLTLGLGELLLLLVAGVLTGLETVVRVCLWGRGADGGRLTRWVEELLRVLDAATELPELRADGVCPG